MEKPKYVLKSTEAVLHPVNHNPALSVLKKVVWIVIAVIIIGSFVFRSNLFMELSGTARVLLIALAIVLFFVGGKQERIPSPFEIRFYEDYLIIYREKHYYSPKISRMEYNKFYYHEVQRCLFRTKTQRINIVGTIEGIWYDYNKNGTLPKEPTYHKTTKGGICYFYTNLAPETDFVREIEAHSPLKVTIENS